MRKFLIILEDPVNCTFVELTVRAYSMMAAKHTADDLSNKMGFTCNRVEEL